MLSFLRERDSEDLPAPKMAKQANGEVADSVQGGKALSNSSGKRAQSQFYEQQQEYFTVATNNKNVRRSTLLLAILFCMGLLCVLFMIKRSTPQVASASPGETKEAQVEMAIARLTGIKSEIFGRMDEIVQKFYEFSNVLQVHVNELAKNPFELETFLAGLGEKTTNGQKKLDGEAEMVRQQRLRQQIKDLQLLCIMQSEQGSCCMINDRILYKGDPIGDFTVHQISDRFVKLKCEDMEIVLELSQ